MMESADREDIIRNNHVENMKPIVPCNSCEICSKSFSSRSALRRHGNIHEELKRFPCLLCQKTFSQAGSLCTQMESLTSAQVVKKHSLQQVT